MARVAKKPKVIIIAGPNGAGKSTVAPRILANSEFVDVFVNADVIARGLSALDSESMAISAGRIMLARLRELAAERQSFAFETTLASRSFAPWISGLIDSGYDFHRYFIALKSAKLATKRVRKRVLSGGHDVPVDTIHRRYRYGICNLFELYIPIASRWWVWDNSNSDAAFEIASGSREVETVFDVKRWAQLKAGVK